MLPKNRDQKGIVPGYQGQCPDRRFHFPVAMGHVGVLFGRLAQCTTQWDFNREACKWQARRGGALSARWMAACFQACRRPLGAQAERLEL